LRLAHAPHVALVGASALLLLRQVDILWIRILFSDSKAVLFERSHTGEGDVKLVE
jgi:hypothetical protein